MTDQTTPAPIPTTDALVLGTLRGAVTALLDECTETQRNLAARIFPQPVERLGETQLRKLHDLCRRAVEKNRAGRLTGMAR
jgi:hypothetical protein